MAEEVEMTPVAAAEPPKANPLAKPAAPKVPTIKLAPVAHKPVIGGAAAGALKPGLKLPAQNGLKPGLKLPPKPGATVSTLRPGLKLPTQTALKPGVKLPAKPVIRKPGATVTAAPLPKPIAPMAAKPAAPAPVAEKPVAAAAPVPSPAPVAAKPVPPPAPVKPVAVDAQGVGKLPTVEAKAVARDDVAPVVSDNPKPLEALKSVTQKLKGITQEIPQQAILRKTGIIAEGAMSEAQKEAAKHKTARISLSDAMGVAPVKNENAPMKTIRIKRPVGIPGATTPLTPQAKLEAPAEPAAGTETAAAGENAKAEQAASVTQRKTLKIARPGGGAVRPSGKFGIKRPSQATTVAKQPGAPETEAPAGDAAIADIADIPPLPMTPAPAAPANDGPAWLWALSSLVQLAACVAIGALAWLLYQNTQISYF